MNHSTLEISEILGDIFLSAFLSCDDWGVLGFGLILFGCCAPCISGIVGDVEVVFQTGWLCSPAVCPRLARDSQCSCLDLPRVRIMVCIVWLANRFISFISSPEEQPCFKSQNQSLHPVRKILWSSVEIGRTKKEILGHLIDSEKKSLRLREVGELEWSLTVAVQRCVYLLGPSLGGLGDRYSSCLSFLYFCSDAGNWTQGLECARYTLYDLAVLEYVNTEIKAWRTDN